MRWIVTGSQGQLGRCLRTSLGNRPEEMLVDQFSRAELDVSSREAVFSTLEGRDLATVDFLVNAAALTNVDLCESEPVRARAVNRDGPCWLAQWCREQGVRLIQVSTDYVFDGEASRPYLESDPVAPNTVYGRSKEEGERGVFEILPEALIIRTSWLFGPGRNFVGAILKQARLRKSGEASGPLRVVADQRGSPTYAADLAEGIIDLATAGGFVAPLGEARREDSVQGTATGIFHMSNSGTATWFNFAREILDRTGHGHLEVQPITAAELDRPATRPAWSVLDCDRAAKWGVRLRAWQDALATYLESSEVSERLQASP